MDNEVETIDWRHSIPLGVGEVTDGDVPLWAHKQREPYIPEDLTGKTVLDVGAWDGYFSFVAESRDAEHVLAIDSLEQDKSTAGFEYAKDRLDSDVEYRVANMFEIDSSFDVVICFGVLYHVKEPRRLLDKLSTITDETLCLETAINPSPLGRARLDANEGVLGFYENTTYYVPTVAWVRDELEKRGWEIRDDTTHLGAWLAEATPFGRQLSTPEWILPSRYICRAERK